MNKGTIDYKFDIKNMGATFYVPIFIILLQFIYLYWLSKSYIDFQLVMPMFEFFLVPFSCLWVLYLYNDYYESDGGEILFSYPLTTSQHGLLRILFMFTLYTLISLPLFIFVSLKGTVSIVPILLQFVPQFFFFCGLCFLLVTLFKSIGISLCIIAFYVAIEYLTNGEFLPLYHVFYFNVEILDFNILIERSIINCLFGLVFIYIGGRFLRLR